MALFEYLQQTQRFLREQKQEFLNVDDLISYINRARRLVAEQAQCIRVLTPISGQITAWTLTDGGSGYSDNPTLTVSDPDFPSGMLPEPSGLQATATAIVNNGVFASIDSTEGGSGYFQPTLTIEDDTGSGAAATPTLSWINTLNENQEVYLFSNIDLSANPGCDAVYFVRSISVLYNNYRYSLAMYSFSDYQARIRNYAPFQYSYVPAFAAQFGQGTSGSLYFYPLPSSEYAVEFDCLCIPSDLINDQSFEAIPQPWRDAVPYFAAHLALMELQQFNAARFYLELYDKMVQRYSDSARVGRRINPYGRP